MTENTANMKTMLLEERVKGLSYLQIEAKHGIPALEARSIVLEALNEAGNIDPVEQRMIATLQIEMVIKNLVDGLENGSFKHGEAILRAVERLAELHDLNQQTIKHQVTVVSDEETLKLVEVLKSNNAALHRRVASLNLTRDARKALEQWPQWAAEASTDAVEEILYAEEVQ